MADRLDAHSGAPRIPGHQDRPQSRLPSGSRSDGILAAFQIHKMPSAGLTLSHIAAQDFTDEMQCESSSINPVTGVP